MIFVFLTYFTLYNRHSCRAETRTLLRNYPPIKKWTSKLKKKSKKKKKCCLEVAVPVFSLLIGYGVIFFWAPWIFPGILIELHLDTDNSSRLLFWGRSHQGPAGFTLEYANLHSISLFSIEYTVLFSPVTSVPNSNTSLTFFFYRKKSPATSISCKSWRDSRHIFLYTLGEMI